MNPTIGIFFAPILADYLAVSLAISSAINLEAFKANPKLSIAIF
jgi:hypothetical protein